MNMLNSKRLINKLKSHFNNRDVFSPSDESSFLHSLDKLVNSYFDNNLLFFSIKVEYKGTSEGLADFCMQEFKSFLYMLDFLEFVYTSNSIKDKGKNGEIIAVIAMKSILGYDNFLVDSYNSMLPNKDKLYHDEDENKIYTSYIRSKVRYLKKKSSIKSLIYKIILNYKDNNVYFFQNGFFENQTISHIDILRGINLDNESSPIKPLPLENIEFVSCFNNNNISGYESNLNYHLRCYNSIYIFSVKAKSVLSIINMWNVYMLCNKLVISVEDNKIYKLIDKKLEYFSELNYLVENIYSIYCFLLLKFNLSMSRYNMKVLIYNYLPDINDIKNKLYFILPTSEKENAEKIQLAMLKNVNKINSNKIYKDIYKKCKERLMKDNNYLSKFEYPFPFINCTE